MGYQGGHQDNEMGEHGNAGDHKFTQGGNLDALEGTVHDACACVCFGLNDEGNDRYGNPNVPVALRRSALRRQDEVGFERTLNEISKSFTTIDGSFGWEITTEAKFELQCKINSGGHKCCAEHKESSYDIYDYECKGNRGYWYYANYRYSNDYWRDVCPDWSWERKVRETRTWSYCTKYEVAAWHPTDINGNSYDTCHIQITEGGQCIEDTGNGGEGDIYTQWSRGKNYGGTKHYGNNEKCKFNWNGIGVLDIQQFHTEPRWDTLRIGNNVASGADAASLQAALAASGQDQMIGKTEFEFVSDESYTRPGFKFCVRAGRVFDEARNSNNFYSQHNNNGAYVSSAVTRDSNGNVNQGQATTYSENDHTYAGQKVAHVHIDT